MGDALDIAVIGSGVSGLTAAHVLGRRHRVTLYERDERLGGHANTIAVRGAGGHEVGLDTGFIVHNERTYPTLLRLFADLGVRTQESDMSFSVRCEGCGLEYAGARGMQGVMPRASLLGRPRYLRMLAEVKRFHRHARAVLGDPAADRLTLEQFLADGGYSAYFTDHFMLPLTGAVWSSSPTTVRAYPARYLIRFFANHGMLTVTNSPQWKTVVGGSRVYVDAVANRLDRVHVSTPIERIERTGEGVVVNGDRRYDRVVIAAHPDQALAMLADPSDTERRLLGAWTYSSNQTVLHTDGSLLPRAPKLVPGVLMGVSVVIVIGHWLERFLITVPSVWNTAEHPGLPLGLPEIGIALGFAGLFFGSIAWFLSIFPVLPSPAALATIPTLHIQVPLSSVAHSS